jgi:hypothetical protein
MKRIYLRFDMDEYYATEEQIREELELGEFGLTWKELKPLVIQIEDKDNA